MYEEYEVKLKEIKEYIVDRVDKFLEYKWRELNEAAAGGVEQQLLEQWRAAVPASFMVDDAITNDYTNGIGQPIAVENPSPTFKSKANENEELKAQIKILEARNMRLSIELEKYRKQATEATAREKDTRKKAGLPDEPIMENAVRGLLKGFPPSNTISPTIRISEEDLAFQQSMQEHEDINEQMRSEQ